jgi:hypothetical protein
LYTGIAYAQTQKHEKAISVLKSSLDLETEDKDILVQIHSTFVIQLIVIQFVKLIRIMMVLLISRKPLLVQIRMIHVAILLV